MRPITPATAAAIPAAIAALSALSVLPARAGVTHPASPPVRTAAPQVGAPPARAAAQAYTIQPGDTLSAISQRFCGTPADYPALAAASGITSPGMIYPGGTVTITCTGGSSTTAAASTASTGGDSDGKAWGVTYGYPNHCGDGDGDGWDVACQPASAAPTVGTGSTADHEPDGDSDDPATQAQPAVVSQGSGSGSGNVSPGSYSGIQQCIISRESGGQSQVMNSTHHYGLYQFSYSTWVAHGGNGADFGHASVAEQNQVFSNTVAADGYSDWTPYDHCG